MIALGFEGTAHTLGVGVVNEKGKVLANVIKQYRTKTGGIHPREASEHHVSVVGEATSKAFQEAGITREDVGVVCFSQAPGLGPCLRVVATAARAFSIYNNTPLVGVNHCIAHVEIGRKLCNSRDPLTVYASGANTQIIGYQEGRYRVFGECLDQGVGNVLDVFARELGYGFPGGPVLDAMAVKGGREYVPLPYPVKGMDLAFSGLLTEATAKLKSGKFKKQDLAFSLTENAFDMLTEVAERALAHSGKKELLLTGGVASSTFLREKMKAMTAPRKVKLKVPPKSVCVDNGAMIAWTGLLMHEHGAATSLKESVVLPTQRTDQVMINWR